MAARAFNESPPHSAVNHTERKIDRIITAKDIGCRVSIGIHEFFCVPGLEGDVALVRWLDDEKMFVGAYVGKKIELTLSLSHDNDLFLHGETYMQPTGYLWLHADKLPENLAQRYWHFNAELKKNMQR